MSKERLEEINSLQDEFFSTWDVERQSVIAHNLINRYTALVIEQAERAQELEEDIDRLNGALHYQLTQENIRNAVNRKLRKQNKRYREALELIKLKTLDIKGDKDTRPFEIYGIASETLEELE